MLGRDEPRSSREPYTEAVLSGNADSHSDLVPAGFDASKRFSVGERQPRRLAGRIARALRIGRTVHAGRTIGIACRFANSRCEWIARTVGLGNAGAFTDQPARLHDHDP